MFRDRIPWPGGYSGGDYDSTGADKGVANSNHGYRLHQPIDGESLKLNTGHKNQQQFTNQYGDDKGPNDSDGPRDAIGCGHVEIPSERSAQTH